MFVVPQSLLSAIVANVRSVVLAVLCVLEALAASFGLFISLYGVLWAVAVNFGNFLIFFPSPLLLPTRPLAFRLSALRQLIRGFRDGGSGIWNFSQFTVKGQLYHCVALDIFAKTGI